MRKTFAGVDMATRMKDLISANLHQAMSLFTVFHNYLTLISPMKCDKFRE